jgi:glycosyltransferase involved in cell wall biosynthesis
LSGGPVVVSGFLSDTRGVSRAGQLTVAALRHAGVAVIEHDVTYLIDRRRARPSLPVVAGGVWIIVCNPEEALAVLDQHRELSERPLYRIASWVWELPTAPASWLEAARQFHTIWLPSRYCAAALSQCDVPLRVMPYLVPVASPEESGKRTLDPVQFAVFADLRSGASRKNPIGAIEAYMAALPPSSGARLVVKLQGVEADAETVVQIARLASARSDIELVTERLSDAEMARLYSDTDVVLSLHRAEGFGLTLAEAMAAGKAVIGTAWSGNMEFMADAASTQLVGYRLVPVMDPTGLYSTGRWAEPDLEEATRRIRELAHDQSLRRSLGARNRDAIAALARPWSVEALADHEFFGYCDGSAKGA